MATEPTEACETGAVLDGWEMRQDEDWPEGVSEAMRAVAVSAHEMAAGSAASKGYSDDDRLLWTCSVCFVFGSVVAHFVNCQTDEQWWGTRSIDSLKAPSASTEEGHTDA